MQLNEKAYPKPLRLPLGKRIDGKRYMNLGGVELLFDGKVIVEEKMDGKETFFELDKYILWVEDLKRKHSIKYRIPGRYALFDVLERSHMRFLDREMKMQFWKDIKQGRIRIPGNPLIFPVPLVGRGVFKMDEIPALASISAYAIDPNSLKNTWMEGVVVKEDRPLYLIEARHAKFVRREFTEGITTNYTNLPLEYNIIDPSVPVIESY